MTKIVLLTGASSGIGLATAKLLAHKGYKVYGASRHSSVITDLNHPQIQPITMDLTDTSSIEQALEKILDSEGRIDILINNAGYGQFGPIETTAIADARQQFEVNLFGLARLTQLVLPIMREQGQGRIINLSSVGGRLTTLMGGWYHASKYALEALSDGLRMETRAFGITIVLIEPGSVRTPWNAIMQQHLADSSKKTVYSSQAQKMIKRLPKLYQSALFLEPESVAKTIVKVCQKKHTKARYLVGKGSRWLIFLHAILPAKWFDRLVIKSLT